MAEPIDLKVILEGDDARRFLEEFERPIISPRKQKMLKEAREIYKANPI